MIAPIALSATASSYIKPLTGSELLGLWQDAVLLGSENYQYDFGGLRDSIRARDWPRALWHLRGLSEDVGETLLLGGYRGPTRCLGGCSKLSSKLYCFRKGTEVETPHGHVKIEDIKVGDKVMSFSLDDGKAVERTVTGLIRKQTEHWYNVTIGGETIKVTGAHPFWVASEKRWIHARDLSQRMELQQFDGTFVNIEDIKIETLAQPEATYNLEVEQDHNYYAGTKGRTVLVHNSDPFDILFSRDPNTIQASDTFLHGKWKDRTLGEAVEEARALNRLPDGLELEASWVNDEMVAANNRTLWVAQQAGLENVSVGGLQSYSVSKVVDIHLRQSGGPFCAP